EPGELRQVIKSNIDKPPGAGVTNGRKERLGRLLREPDRADDHDQLLRDVGTIAVSIREGPSPGDSLFLPGIRLGHQFAPWLKQVKLGELPCTKKPVLQFFVSLNPTGRENMSDGDAAKMEAPRDQD